MRDGFLKHKKYPLGRAWAIEHAYGSVSGSSFPSSVLKWGLLGSRLSLSLSGRLFSHVGDPFLDDPLPREYVLYLRPTGPLAQKLSDFWQQSKQICGKNKAHNIFPHITLCQFFMVSHRPLPPTPHRGEPGCLTPASALQPGTRVRSLPGSWRGESRAPRLGWPCSE